MSPEKAPSRLITVLNVLVVVIGAVSIGRLVVALVAVLT